MPEINKNETEVAQIELSPNMKAVAKILESKNLSYNIISETVIVIGFNKGDVFIDVNIIEEKNLNRILYLAKFKNLTFDAEMLPAIQDIIGEINNNISYGHIVLGVAGPNCYALYKTFSPIKYITADEVFYNLDACNYMVENYFDEFSHLGQM